MNEEPNQFPLPNPFDLILVDIESELTKEGITLQKHSVDELKKIITVPTDKEVSEKGKSRIREYAKSYDYNIEFLTV